MAKLHNLRDLFSEQLRDLFSAETQLIEVLPKLADATRDELLKLALNDQVSQTKVHVERLQGILSVLEETAEKQPCKVMESLIAESREIIEQPVDSGVKDAALIAAAQKMEHYKIAGYGAARTFAELLEYGEAADLLQMTLDEEADLDERLTEVALDLNLNSTSLRRTEQEQA